MFEKFQSHFNSQLTKEFQTLREQQALKCFLKNFTLHSPKYFQSKFCFHFKCDSILSV